MISGIHLGHVADAITSVTGDDDYDAVADDAYILLVRFPELGTMADRWDAGAIAREDFTSAVRAVLDTVNAEAWLAEFAELAGDPPF
jgi:hypothetical protein